MKLTPDQKTKDAIRYIVAACIVILFYCLMTNLSAVGALFDQVMGVLSPFIFGIVLAYLLRPVCNLIQNLLLKLKFMHKVPSIVKFISVSMAFIFGFGIITLLGFAILPPLFDSLSELVETLPGVVRDGVVWVQNFLEEDPELQSFVYELYAKADTILKTDVMPSMSEIVDIISEGAIGVLDVLKTLFIGIIVSVYILADKDRLKNLANKGIDMAFKPKLAQGIKEEITFADKTFTKYIIGTLLDAVLVGVITYIFCLIAGMPSPILLAVTIASTNIIPIVGPFIGAIPTALIVLAYAPDKFIMYCIYLLIMQQVDGHILVPKVLGGAVGVSGLTALLAIIIGGGLFGVPGMVLGVPIVTVGLDVGKKIIAYRKSQHETPVQSTEEETE